jgi:hypothetical protein
MRLAQVIGSLLVFYGWVVAAILIFFLFLIGRLYEVKFRQRSNYRFMLLPLALFLIASAWYLLAPAKAFLSGSRDFLGLLVPDLLFLLGGALLTALCYSLYRIMIARKG